MPSDTARSDIANPRSVAKRVVFGIIGLALGGLFLHLALRNISRQDFEAVLQRFDRSWLAIGVAVYMASIALRCLRWGILLRTNGAVKWRHAVEALLAGYAANYLLPARIGELFRADYAMRLFHMSRFTSLGTIFVERVCDGIILVCALWICLGILSFGGANPIVYPSWTIAAGTTASVVFGLALLFALLSGRLDLRRFGLPDFILVRWENLTDGISSVARGQTGTIILCTIGIWMLEVIALGCVARAFAAVLSVPQTIVLVVLGSLSTLIPTAPGFLGTFQFVFAQVFALFGYPQSMGVVVSTTMQVFCFGVVTILGVFVLLSRSGLAVLRALRLNAKDPP
jgi:glycosyltransferase 2 family protein